MKEDPRALDQQKNLSITKTIQKKEETVDAAERKNGNSRLQKSKAYLLASLSSTQMSPVASNHLAS